jgi:hypothetical protein
MSRGANYVSFSSMEALVMLIFYLFPYLMCPIRWMGYKLPLEPI